jgi:rubrerythrin
MVLIWIGIALGVLITSALIFKIMKTSKNNYISLMCKKCGFKTNGLKCPICENEKRI